MSDIVPVFAAIEDFDNKNNNKPASIPGLTKTFDPCREQTTSLHTQKKKKVLIGDTHRKG